MQFGDKQGSPVSVTMELPAIAASASMARHVTNSALAWQTAGIQETAELLVSELITNALIHAGSAPTLQIGVKGRSVRITVTDDSRLSPQPKEDADEGGRGLALVGVLAACWGWSEVATGKTVWFELATTGPEPLAMSADAK